MTRNRVFLTLSVVVLAHVVVRCASHSIEAGSRIAFSILHTNDLHSSFDGPTPHRYTHTADFSTQGHLAYLASVIEEEAALRRSRGTPFFLLDGGDWYEGSLLHVIGPRGDVPQTPELEFFDTLNYDYIAIGNHDFSAGEDALIRMIMKAKQSGLKTSFLVPNFESLEDDPSECADVVQNVQAMGDAYLIREIPTEHGALRVGIFALFSPDAAFTSIVQRSCVHVIGFNDATVRPEFDRYVDYVAGVVQKLREHELVDLVVATAHSGYPEDKELIHHLHKRGLHIDVHISSHTHKVYQKIVEGTIVQQAGCCASRLGLLDLVYVADDDIKGHVELLHPIRREEGKIGNGEENEEELAPSVRIVMPEDGAHVAVSASIRANKELVNHLLGEKLGYRYEDPVGVVLKDLVIARNKFNPLALIIGTGLRYELNHDTSFLARSGSRVDVYIMAVALVRADMMTIPGSKKPALYEFSDIFSMLSLGRDMYGISPDIPGGPIVDFYFTPTDLKKVIDVVQLYYWIHRDSYFVYSDNFDFDVRWWGIPLINRIHFSIDGIDESHWDNHNLVHVASNGVVAGYIEKMKKLSKGWIDIVFREKNGTPIPFEELFVKRQHGREHVRFADYFRKVKRLPPMLPLLRSYDHIVFDRLSAFSRSDMCHVEQ